MTEPAQQQYWCHCCEKQFDNPIRDSVTGDGGEILCPFCRDPFVEILEDESDHPQNFVEESPPVEPAPSPPPPPPPQSQPQIQSGNVNGMHFQTFTSAPGQAPQNFGNIVSQMIGGLQQQYSGAGPGNIFNMNFNLGSSGDNFFSSVFGGGGGGGGGSGNTGSSGLQGNIQQDLSSVFTQFLGLPSGANLADYGLGQSLSDIISQLQDPNRHGPPPADKDFVRSMPRMHADKDFLAGLDEDSTSCSVCKDEFVEGAVLLRLPCGHLFCEECITPWLDRHNTCPNCRKTVPSESDTSQSGNQPTSQNHAPPSQDTHSSHSDVTPPDFDEPEPVD